MDDPPQRQEQDLGSNLNSNSKSITLAWVSARLILIDRGVTEVSDGRFSQEALELAADAARELGNALLGLGFMDAWKTAMQVRHEFQNPLDENFALEDLIANVILLGEKVELCKLAK